MTVVRIEEPLPDDPTEAAAVLHVRRDLRRRIRATTGPSRRSLLAMLFGVPSEDAKRFAPLDLVAAPVAGAASLLGGGSGVVVLGWDKPYVEQCRRWLLTLKEQEPAFSAIFAYDLETLLALHRATLIARAGASPGRPPIPIVVGGETGTGKELLTQAIHALSGRTGKLVPVHVSGMSADHIESKLFGHTKGAYTGAIRDRKGLLEEAKGGTIHLDEVGDLPMTAQVGLLRVLQDGSYSRLGDDQPFRADVRVIAATWRDLSAMMEAGTFRRDLYHRICASEIILPPLRRRKTGFRELVNKLVEQLSPGSRLLRSTMDALAVYEWPGNLRELEGALRLASSGACDGVVRVEDLPVPIQTAYLKAPIEIRGPGLLCDDPDGLEVQAAAVDGRVAALVDRVSGDTPLPDVSPFAGHFIEVMDRLPDSSGEHGRVLASLKAAILQDQQAQRQVSISERMAVVAGAGALPDAVAAAVQAAVADLRAHAERMRAEASAAHGEVDLRASVWGRFFEDLLELPIFQGQNHIEILSLMKMAVLIVQSVDPAIVDAMRESLKAGGMTVVREWLVHQIIDVEAGADAQADEGEGAEENSADGLPAGDRTTWTKQDWERVVSGYPSGEALAKQLGVTSRTLRKDLNRFEVRPPWSRRRPSS